MSPSLCGGRRRWIGWAREGPWCSSLLLFGVDAGGFGQGDQVGGGGGLEQARGEVGGDQGYLWDVLGVHGREGHRTGQAERGGGRVEAGGGAMRVYIHQHICVVHGSE